MDSRADIFGEWQHETRYLATTKTLRLRTSDPDFAPFRDLSRGLTLYLSLVLSTVYHMKRCRAYHFVNGYDCREGASVEEQIELEDRRGGCLPSLKPSFSIGRPRESEGHSR